MRALFVLAVTATIGFAFSGGSKSEVEAWEGHENWPKATVEPEDMTLAMALSCVGPMRHDRSPNPHTPKVFEVFVNPIGKTMMLAKDNRTFPVGTIIVKRKYDRSALMGRSNSANRVRIKKGAMPELLTIMQKTRKGWTYRAANGSGKALTGDTRYCASCHQTAEKSDFVFRPYVRPFRGGTYR